MGKKLKMLVFMADGFEEVEALTVVDYLRRADVEVDTVSITEDKQVKGAHEIIVTADKIMSELEYPKSYSGIIIPGGINAVTKLNENEQVIELVKDFNNSKKLLGAMCAGPIVFQEAGIIKGRKVTSYPTFENQLGDCQYSRARVVKDGNLITSRGAAIAGDFAMELIGYLLGQGKINELKENILYEN